MFVFNISLKAGNVPSVQLKACLKVAFL